jgi:hypothetical protein
MDVTFPRVRVTRRWPGRLVAAGSATIGPLIAGSGVDEQARMMYSRDSGGRYDELPTGQLQER